MSYVTTIDLGDIGEHEVIVCFDYRSGWPGSFNEPPEYPEVELTAVLFHSTDLLSLLTPELKDRLEQEAFDDVRDSYQQHLEDQAEQRHFDREAA